MANKSYFDIQVNFQDSISDLAFADQQRYLAATSWDGYICVWEFSPDYSNYKIQRQHKDQQKSAFLRCCFNPECNYIFFGTSQGKIQHLPVNDVNNSKPGVSYEYTSPIVGLRYCSQKSLLVALSLDSIIHIFMNDTVVKISIPTKPICMDISGTRVLIGGIGPAIYHLDLNNISDKSQVTPIQTLLQYQIRSISISKGRSDLYIVGSIFGQAEIVNEKEKVRQLVTCHREENSNRIFASNSVAMVGNEPLAISAGGNGDIKFINFDKPKGGRDLKISNYPLTCIAISPGKEVAAIAQGYDWSRGADIYKTDRPQVSLYIKKISSNEF